MAAEICTCPIRPGMTYEELYVEVLPYNCKKGRWICSKLDSELIRAKKDRDVRTQYDKRRKKQSQTGSVPKHRVRNNPNQQTGSVLDDL